MKTLAIGIALLLGTIIGLPAVAFSLPAVYFFALYLRRIISPPEPGGVPGNNVANLEALLNTWANVAELGGIILGVLFIGRGLIAKNSRIQLIGSDIELGKGQCITIGVGLIVGGLACPGIMNYLVAIGRDAHLFS